MIPRPIVSAIALVVTLVWTGNFVADIVVDGYESDPMIHAAFMAILGSAFALGRKNQQDDGDDSDSSSPRHARKED